MRILFVNDQFPAAREMLAERLPDDEVLLSTPAEAPDADVVVPLMGKIDGALMDRARPRLIQQYGVGLEGVDLAAAAERGIAVANVPAEDTGNADAVGEITVLHLLSLSRRFGEARASVDAGRIGEPIGTALRGSRIVVLGLGAIGRAVARCLGGFGTETIGVATREVDRVGDDYDGLGLSAYLPIDPADPLLAERVTVTPHIGGVTTSSYGLMAASVAANVERLRRGEPLHATAGES